MAAPSGARSLVCTCVFTALNATQNRRNMLALSPRSMLCYRVETLGAYLPLKPTSRSVKIGKQVVGALRSLCFLVKHSLPHTSIFGPFLDFCILQGCEYLSSLHSAGNAHYRSERTIQEFLHELGTAVFSTRLQESPYIALMADETTDIAMTKELILYVRFIPSATSHCCVRSIFLQVADGKAETITTSILELLTSLDISINKVMGFGSDGASVMVGRIAGVATEMVSIHCVAHRFALAVAPAGDAVPYIKKIST